MSDKEVEPIDSQLFRCVNHIDAVTPPEDDPELIVLCCIFYKLNQIKDKLDVILK